MVRVLPGWLLVLASPFLLTKVFMSDDLPTLLRPMSAISGRSSASHWSGVTALFINSALVIFIICLLRHHRRPGASMRVSPVLQGLVRPLLRHARLRPVKVGLQKGAQEPVGLLLLGYRLF